MPGKTGFDFNGASKSFNVLAEYLFGKVVRKFVINSYSTFLVMLLIFITFCLFWFLCWFLEYNKGEDGDDYTCFYA
jgi:hypothetical protein